LSNLFSLAAGVLRLLSCHKVSLNTSDIKLFFGRNCLACPTSLTQNVLQNSLSSILHSRASEEHVISVLVIFWLHTAQEASITLRILTCLVLVVGLLKNYIWAHA
jgi:hypothetical protein